MIHWSHFAASLWDCVLAAHVHPDNLNDQVLTFNAAVDDFVSRTFAGMSERWPAFPRRRCEYVRLCFDNLMLRARRATLSLPQLGDVSDLLQLSISSMARAGTPASTDVYIFHYQMITTVAASLHLLSSVLVSIQSLEDLDLHPWTSLEFNAAINLLDALATSIPLAQRVSRDFERIVPVIRHAISMLAEETNSFQDTLNTSILVDFIPSNAVDLLPYRKQFPHTCSPLLHGGMWTTNGDCFEKEHGFSALDAGPEPDVVRNSVLWV